MIDKRKCRKSLNIVLVFCSFALVISGCATNNEPMPQIVYTPGHEPELIPPILVEPKQTDDNSYTGTSRAWLPSPHVEKQWSAIIIHHSATASGNAAIFDRWHREHNGWEGVGYDFVIGNGTESGDGQVEVTFRWQRQIPGAHCGGTPGNWANEDGIGICLVGDFNITTPTRRQLESLVKLTRFLQERYEIPNSRIYGHGTAPGARVTDCPGTRFSIPRFKSTLGY